MGGSPIADIFSVSSDFSAKIMNVMVEDIHKRNVEAGWWHDLSDGQPMNSLADYCSKIALIHSEVSEALEGLRKDLQDDKLPHRKAVEVELADTIIRIFDLAGALELDLGGAFVEKLRYNEVRADHKVENRMAPGGKAF